MDDNMLLSNDEQAREEFIRGIAKAPDAADVKIGNVVTGKIIQFDDTDVFIDLEYKTEGRIRREEFDQDPIAGETVEVRIVEQDNEGYIRVSKSAVDRVRSHELIERAWESGEPIKGTVKEAIKGGFIVSLRGTQAFCPFSQVDIARNTKEEYHIGKEYDFRIIKRTGRDLVVSRRILQEEQQNMDIDKFLDSLKIGDIIKGVVKNIERFGVFVEITPGLDGFISLSNISWDKLIEPRKVVSKHDERMFKVLSIDKEKRKVELGLKQLDDDPWVKFVEIYKIGDIIQGEVTSVKKFGAFVKVYDSVEGLVHISDLSWNSHVKNPNEFVKAGAFLECKILEIEISERRLTLGIKQIKDNPWHSVSSLYPIKKPVSCTVRRILRNFAVFELPNGLEAICDVSDFDWKYNLVNIKDYIKEGDVVNMIVIFIDNEKQKIKLSYKHTTESPWRLFEREYPNGSIVNGTVKSIVEAGAVVELPDALEGFVHVSQIDMPKGANVADNLKIGESYPFVVKEVNQSKRRVSLSRRDYVEAESKKEMRNYISKEEATSLTFNYFDDMGDKSKR